MGFRLIGRQTRWSVLPIEFPVEQFLRNPTMLTVLTVLWTRLSKSARTSRASSQKCVGEYLWNWLQ